MNTVGKADCRGGISWFGDGSHVSVIAAIPLGCNRFNNGQEMPSTSGPTVVHHTYEHPDCLIAAGVVEQFF